MKRKRSLIFLPIVLAAGLILGACNNAPAPDPTPAVTTHTVTFSANGGSGTMADVTGVSGEYALPASTFTAPAGKHFTGWKVGNDATLKQPGDKVAVNGDVTVVAQWEVTTYAVSFDANGGTGSMAAVQVVGEYTLPASTFVAPSGKEFAGWKVGNDATIKQPGDKVNIAGPATVSAQWTLITYEVTFDANGGTGTMEAVQVVGEYTLPASTFVAPSGKEFGGWKVGNDATVKQPGDKVNIAGPATVVAQWTLITYEVTFDANGGTGSMESVRVVGEYTLPESTFTAPEGHAFGGWKVGNDATVKQPGDKVEIAGPATVVAQWTANNYTVKFMNGDQELDTKQVAYGTVATYEGQEPTKAADAEAPKYRFKGWDKDITAPIKGDTTFNAQFAVYQSEILVDDFESYTGTSSMKSDGKWKALQYVGSAWSDAATNNDNVNLSHRAAEGNNALRFELYKHNVAYKFHKDLNKMEKSVNAISFKLMAPTGFQTVRVMLGGSANIGGQAVGLTFKHDIEAKPGEYSEYVIPFNDPAWVVEGFKDMTMADVAAYAGMSEDDVLPLLNNIEFYVNEVKDTAPKSYVFVDDIKFLTLDNPTLIKIDDLQFQKVYTGLTADGYTLKLEMGDVGTATATVLDTETPQVLQGSVSFDPDGNIKFTSADSGASLVYVGKPVNGGYSLECVSVAGALAAFVGEMDLFSVQTVENCERYTEDGVSWNQSTEKADRKGARGAYYSEYYAGSGSDEWGGDKWNLMGGKGDQLSLATGSGAHSGNQYLKLKNSKTFAMRYIQWGLYDGTSDQNTFRGTKLSFWAKSEGSVPSFKVSAYSQVAPRNATKDKDMKYLDVTDVSGEWKHYEVTLNPDLVYYGFLVFMEKNQSADSYLYIDDVEVYTVSPYAEYVPPVQNVVMPKNMTYTAKINGLYNAILEVKDGSNVTLSAPGLGLNNVPGTYVTTTEDIEITVGSDKYIATVSNDKQTLTFKAIEGTGQAAQLLNNASFKMIDYADNAETYSGQGKMYYASNQNKDDISGARGAYHCDFYKEGNKYPSIIGGSNWSLMEGNGDQLQLDTTTAYDGNQSLKMRYSTAGNMRYLQWGLTDGSGTPHSNVDTLGMYVKNPNNVDVKIKIYAYYNAKVEPGNQGSNRSASNELTIPANSDWTLLTLDLDSSKTYYGYGIYMVTKSSAGYINVDKVFYGRAFENPEVNFYAPANLVLSGNITAGAASFTFGKNGTVTLTCAELGGDLLGSYKMGMSGTTQVMIVKTSVGVITGSYAVSDQGVVTFTVINVTGDLAAGVSAGNTVTNAI